MCLAPRSVPSPAWLARHAPATHKTICPTGPPVEPYQFDGQPITALEGETIAAALSAANIVAFRHTLTGAPRGLHCGMGACFDCVVTVDGRIGQRACMTKVADGMVVTGDAKSAAGAARPPNRTPRNPEERACDVLVVGGGPAGLSAAIAAAEAGASVVVLDERSATGGQYAKPLADSHTDAAPDAQFRLGTDLRTRALAAGARIETEATVWGGFAPDEIAALVARTRDHLSPTPPDPRAGRARTPGAAARLDAAGRDDHRLVADTRPGPARLSRRTRADCRQRSAQPAACLRTAGVRREADRGGGGRAASRPRRLAPGMDDGAHVARPGARGLRHAGDA